ncbi:type II toxin-antitoxin system RelE/ParE family toxin [Bradyrhizobium sp. RT6a]|uniref:type II toxin-antitoxin system RelE/ParE family toxin n=1 Tax=Bradyrhizobium sp. RT6a TaxID=3156381 RepID=UPI0033952B3F
MPPCRVLGKGLREVRSEFEGNRSAGTVLWFCVHEGRMVLLRVFIKKTQKTPQAEIDLAQKRRKEIT